MTIACIKGCAVEIAREDGQYLISIVAPDQRWHEARHPTYPAALAATRQWIDENAPAAEAATPTSAQS